MADEDLEFILTIDFAKNSGDPRRIFRAADRMISIFDYIDGELQKALGIQFDTSIILSDITNGSLKVFLRNLLKDIEDDDLKKLDVKSIIGKFLVQAKYYIIAALEKSEDLKGPDDLKKIRSDIQELAKETDLKFAPYYGSPDNEALVNIGRLINGAKAELLPEDRIIFQASGSSVSLNPGKLIDDGKLIDISAENRVFESDMPMTLVVKKADYIGNSKWSFRSERGMINARITDNAWLDQFHQKRITITPGDAIDALVSVEVVVGDDNKPLQTIYTVIKVKRVVPGKWEQVALPF